MCGCDCVGMGAIVWVDVGVIACVCVHVCVCVGVCVIAFMKRAQGSLDEWCMFVWCGRAVNYVGLGWIYKYVGEASLIDSE